MVKGRAALQGREGCTNKGDRERGAAVGRERKSNRRVTRQWEEEGGGGGRVYLCTYMLFSRSNTVDVGSY